MARLTTYTRLALSRSLCDSYASASFTALGLFTALGFCVIHSLPTDTNCNNQHKHITVSLATNIRINNFDHQLNSHISAKEKDIIQGLH